MTNILVTGMTAPQASVRSLRRAENFVSQVLTALRSNPDNVVTWSTPSVEMDKNFLDQYDVVLVGVAPVTGLGSTYAYGALSIIQHLYADPKLRLFIDGPNPQQITHSLNSIVYDRSSLVKSFYRTRSEYAVIQESAELQERVYTAIYWLAKYQWPITIYPRLPWEQEDPEPLLPESAAGRIRSVNLDVFSLQSLLPLATPRLAQWVVDNPQSPWTMDIAKTVRHPVVDMRPRKFARDPEVENAMASSTGVLIAPTKRHRTWWTARYLQALRLRVPIVTVREDAECLGREWSVLASQIEEMSAADRSELSELQLESYLSAIGDEEIATNSLEEFLGIRKGISWPTTTK